MASTESEFNRWDYERDIAALDTLETLIEYLQDDLRDEQLKVDVERFHRYLIDKRGDLINEMQVQINTRAAQSG